MVKYHISFKKKKKIHKNESYHLGGDCTGTPML
jgi:hypothetical protein